MPRGGWGRVGCSLTLLKLGDTYGWVTSFFFRATPEAYGGSQARGPIRAIAASLCLSHSNARSELHR